MTLTEHQRHEIIVRREDGMPISQIAKKLGTSRVTVYSWIKRYDETNTLNRKKGTDIKNRNSDK